MPPTRLQRVESPADSLFNDSPQPESQEAALDGETRRVRFRSTPSFRSHDFSSEPPFGKDEEIEIIGIRDLESIRPSKKRAKHETARSTSPLIQPLPTLSDFELGDSRKRVRSLADLQPDEPLMLTTDGALLMENFEAQRVPKGDWCMRVLRDMEVPSKSVASQVKWLFVDWDLPGTSTRMKRAGFLEFLGRWKNEAEGSDDEGWKPILKTKLTLKLKFPKEAEASKTKTKLPSDGHPIRELWESSKAEYELLNPKPDLEKGPEPKLDLKWPQFWTPPPLVKAFLPFLDGLSSLAEHGFSNLKMLVINLKGYQELYHDLLSAKSIEDMAKEATHFSELKRWHAVTPDILKTKRADAIDKLAGIFACEMAAEIIKKRKISVPAEKVVVFGLPCASSIADALMYSSKQVEKRKVGKQLCDTATLPEGLSPFPSLSLFPASKDTYFVENNDLAREHGHTAQAPIVRSPAQDDIDGQSREALSLLKNDEPHSQFAPATPSSCADEDALVAEALFLLKNYRRAPRTRSPERPPYSPILEGVDAENCPERVPQLFDLPSYSPIPEQHVGQYPSTGHSHSATAPSWNPLQKQLAVNENSGKRSSSQIESLDEMIL